MKLNIVAKIFSEYTKLPITDLKLYSCILSTVSPFALAFLAHDTFELLPVKFSEKELAAHTKEVVLAGLDKFREA